MTQSKVDSPPKSFGSDVLGMIRASSFSFTKTTLEAVTGSTQGLMMYQQPLKIQGLFVSDSDKGQKGVFETNWEGNGRLDGKWAWGPETEKS